ncbi:MAG: hypothetical protein ABEH47_03950 [Haloferacaceae archaeon]
MADSTDEGTDAGVDRPRFRGCVVCYSAEWVAYGARRLRRRVSADA